MLNDDIEMNNYYLCVIGIPGFDQICSCGVTESESSQETILAKKSQEILIQPVVAVPPAYSENIDLSSSE